MQTYYYFNKKLNQYVLIADITKKQQIIDWFATKGFNNLNTREFDGTFRVIIPNENKVLVPIKNKFVQGEIPGHNTSTQWVDETHIKLTVPSQNADKATKWIDGLGVKYSVARTLTKTMFIFEYSDRATALLKKYPPTQPAIKPSRNVAPQHQLTNLSVHHFSANFKLNQPKASQPKVKPSNVTVDTLKKQLSNLSHFALNQLAKEYGIDAVDMQKQDKIQAIAIAAHKIKHAA